MAKNMQPVLNAGRFSCRDGLQQDFQQEPRRPEKSEEV